MLDDEDVAILLHPQRLRVACRGKAARKTNDAGGLKLFAERLHIAEHRFVLNGRVVVVGS